MPNNLQGHLIRSGKCLNQRCPCAACPLAAERGQVGTGLERAKGHLSSQARCGCPVVKAPGARECVGHPLAHLPQVSSH